MRVDARGSRDYFVFGTDVDWRIRIRNVSRGPISFPAPRNLPDEPSPTAVNLSIRRRDIDIYGAELRRTWNHVVSLRQTTGGCEVTIRPGGVHEMPARLPAEDVGAPISGIRILEMEGILRGRVRTADGEDRGLALDLRPGRVVIVPAGYEPLASDPLGSLARAVEAVAPTHLLVATEFVPRQQSTRALAILVDALAEGEPALSTAALSALTLLRERSVGQPMAPFVEPLLAALDLHPERGDALMRGLTRVSGQTIAPDARLWRDWWRRASPAVPADSGTDGGRRRMIQNLELAEHLGTLARTVDVVIPEDELLAKLKKGRPLRCKLGMDLTSPTVHIGNGIPLWNLRRLQDLGHVAVLILGDYTATVGDPSGKDKTRPMLTQEEIEQNGATWLEQVASILDMDKVEVRKNGEWFSQMSFLDVLSLTDRMTVQQMMERDSFETRWKATDPISVREFLYCLMQGWDSVMVKADVELGGTDQTFNLNVGRRLMGQEGLEPQVSLISPLIEGTDGQAKMSKSLGNAIGIQDEPKQMFGMAMRVPDALIGEVPPPGDRCRRGRDRTPPRPSESAGRQARARRGAGRALSRRGGRRRGAGGVPSGLLPARRTFRDPRDRRRRSRRGRLLLGRRASSGLRVRQEHQRSAQARRRWRGPPRRSEGHGLAGAPDPRRRRGAPRGPSPVREADDLILVEPGCPLRTMRRRRSRPRETNVLLAEIPFPLIPPEIVKIGPLTVRWYGLTYVIGFALAWLVLKNLAKRGRWPVEPEKAADVLFWGILGVFFGARVGWVFFYGMHLPDWSWARVFNVWEGGMSFHGGLLGVLFFYTIFLWRTKKPAGAFCDGIVAAAPLGIFCVRIGNFINAELYGHPWTGPWAMRFPRYDAFKGGPSEWRAAYEASPAATSLWTELRHPSQLYEALFEGLLMYFFLRFLMLTLNVGGGRITAWFLVAYGAARFVIEFFRVPDRGMENVFLGMFSRGQELCLFMILAGLILFAVIGIRSRRRKAAQSTELEAP